MRPREALADNEYVSMDEHSDLERLSLNVKVCRPARDGFRALASEHGVSEAALADACMHACSMSDPEMMAKIVRLARRIDAERRRRGH